jgi:hypothetical protein
MSEQSDGQNQALVDPVTGVDGPPNHPPMQQAQLPRWRSHKTVWAAKITEVDSTEAGARRWLLDGGDHVDPTPQLQSRIPAGTDPIGGYYVRYEDGFESWSPAAAFEGGYTRFEPGAADDAAGPTEAQILASRQGTGIIASDAAAAAVSKAARVSLADIEAAIKWRFDVNAAQAVGATEGHKVNADSSNSMESLAVLSLCILVMRNGYSVVGTSAPAHPQNYEQQLGKRLAYEDAIRQIWPLMGWQLRSKLAGLG